MRSVRTHVDSREHWRRGVCNRRMMQQSDRHDRDMRLKCYLKVRISYVSMKVTDKI